jgi:hypothetical protein
MAKLPTKFYKLSESWLKTADIASGIYAYLTVFFNHGRDGDDDDDYCDDASLARYRLAYHCFYFTSFCFRSFQNYLQH